MFYEILIWCKIVCPVLESAYKNECKSVMYFYVLIISTEYESLSYMFSEEQYQMRCLLT
jgi:hypothetical protein